MANQYGESYCGGTPTFYTVMGQMTSGPPQFSCSNLSIEDCGSGNIAYQGQVLIHSGCYVITPGPSVNVTPGIGSRGGRRNIRRQSTRRGKVPGNGGDNPMIPFCAVPSNQNLPECEGWGTPSWDKKRRGGRLKPKPRRRMHSGGHMHKMDSKVVNHQHLSYQNMPDGSEGFMRTSPPVDSNSEMIGPMGRYRTQMDRQSIQANQRRKGGGVKKYPHGGMHMGGNTACRMITSRTECVSPCKWEFDYGTCH